MERSKLRPQSSSNNYKNPCLIPLLDQMSKDRNATGDVKFILESEEILAHRCVLAALSPKYKAQFYGSQPESGDIKVEGVSAAAFKEFLQFFYIEDVSLTIENIEDVINLAEQSLAENLVKMCEKFLIDTSELGRISRYLWLVRLYNLKDLEKKCDDLVKMNIQKFFKSNAASKFVNDLRDPPYYRSNITNNLTERFLPSSDSVYGIEFRCNKVIDLYGFVMLSSIDNFKVNIHDGNSWLKNYPKIMDTFIDDEHIKYFEVLFKKPVKILPTKKLNCKIDFVFPVRIRQRRLHLFTNIEQNDVCFTFKQPNDKKALTLISHLLYVNLDKS